MHGKLLAAARNLEFALGEDSSTGERAADGDHVDRYEDMLDEVELAAGLPSLNLDFEDEDAPSSEESAS